jgi:hypothetical protein
MTKDVDQEQHYAIRAWRAADAVVTAGAERYERARHLPRLLPIGPEEIGDTSRLGSRKILLRVARALRAERARGRAGHWTYDMNRHIGLIQAYRAELSGSGGGAPTK